MGGYANRALPAGGIAMRNVKWLVAASLVASLTACVDMNGYPTTSYGGYPSYGYNSGYNGYNSGYNGYNSGYNGYNSGYGYSGYNSGYYAQPSSYYQPTPVYQ